MLSLFKGVRKDTFSTIPLSKARVVREGRADENEIQEERGRGRQRTEEEQREWKGERRSFRCII